MAMRVKPKGKHQDIFFTAIDTEFGPGDTNPSKFNKINAQKQLQKLLQEGDFIQHNKLLVSHKTSDKIGLKLKALQHAEKRRKVKEDVDERKAGIMSEYYNNKIRILLNNFLIKYGENVKKKYMEEKDIATKRNMAWLNLIMTQKIVVSTLAQNAQAFYDKKQ